VRRVRPLCAVLAAVAVLGGCGGADEPVGARDGVLDLELVDFRIVPQQWTAKRGELTFSVINRGKLPHNLHVKGPGGSRVEISTMLPGEGGQAIKRFPRGSYRRVCTIANHEELGMYGRLVVR
jgi:plastocyanin